MTAGAGRQAGEGRMEGANLVMHFSLRNNQNTLQIFADSQHSPFNLFPQLAVDKYHFHR